MHKVILTLTIFATVAMSSTAMAQRPGQGNRGERGGPRGGQRGFEGRMPVSPLMLALDADKDGKLSPEEIANATAALKALDKNKDGSLEPSELMPQRSERGAREGGRRGGGPRGDDNARGGDPSERINQMMTDLDKDKDGKISKEEGGERMSRFFGMMDGDQDGFLTKDEMTKAMSRMRGGGNRGGGNRGGGNRGGGYGSQPKSKDNRPEFDDK